MSYQLEVIRPEYDAEICQIIKRVGEEYGAVGEGFGPGDAEVTHMSQHYTRETKSLYLVAKIGDQIVGGCGLAAFNGSETTCELRKLFLLEESRGLGLGKTLTQACLTFAKEQGYQRCYLDTLSNMKAAIALYEKLGFEHLTAPLAGTPHGKCDVWMIKLL